MGKIKKVPTERHTATASPAITNFVSTASSIPLHQLPAKLSEFPVYWPHPRGDLYHWIPLLDRFDHILELFNQEYGLNDGPQTQQIAQTLLLKGDGVPANTGSISEKELASLGYSDDGDRELIETVVRFTCLLQERCGNRSLYASSEHINCLLHTTSLSLLKCCLQLSLLLARRYQVARYKNGYPHAQAGLLASHYAINLDNMHTLALPLRKPRAPVQALAHTPGRPKDKTAGPSFNPADLATFVKGDISDSVRKDLTTVSLTWSNSLEQPSTTAHADATPSTPTPDRRQPTRPSAGDRTVSTNSAVETPTKHHESYFPSNMPRTLEISANAIEKDAAYVLVSTALPKVPKEKHFELLHSIRIAKAIATGDFRTVLDIRLLAIANMAFAVSESKFHERIGQPDSNEAKRFHLATQLCDLLQPGTNGQRSLPLDSQTIVLNTIEALARGKHKSSEIIDALGVTVNHGMIYYELRQAVASLRDEEEPQDDTAKLHLIQWRNAVFDLTGTISQINNHVKCAEKMVQSGIMEILVEALVLRTTSAERAYEKIMGFLSSFIHGINNAFQALAAARGLEIIADLASHEVSVAMQQVREGKGMPAEAKSKVVDYEISYYQQATLRSVFKFVVHLFDHNSGVHDRLLRNLLDSPQTLGALREIISNATIFGSNVWDAAINTVTNFIHNEPTSFQVIAEAGLAKGIIEAVTQKPVSDEPHSHSPIELQVIDGKIQYPEVRGILPVTETILDIPGAFGALCLNEDGMTMFQSSGVLDAYLHIFLSPAHVRALEEESQSALSVGNAFDELARHHPGLQDQILDAVERTLKSIQFLAALPQSKASPPLVQVAAQSDGTDTQMRDADDNKDQAQLDVMKLVHRAPAMPFITAFFKFLEGFFHNSSMCQKFCQRGAAATILDLITSEAVPYELSAFPVKDKIGQVLHRMAEDKASLVLPEVLSRLIAATDKLENIITSDAPTTMYSSLVRSEQASPTLPELGKSMADATALCVMLSRVFHPIAFAPRNTPSNTILSSVNFWDVYTKVFHQLGKIHAWCIQADIAVIDQMPDIWETFSEPEPHSVRGIDADGVVHTNIRCPHCDFPNMTERPKFVESLQDGDKPQKIEAFRNVRAFRFLSSQLPFAVESFFVSMIHVAVPKRSAEPLAKYHLFALAHSLATAVAAWFSDRDQSQSNGIGSLKYINANLAALPKLFLKIASNIDTFGTKEACLLALWKFYDAGGFEQLNICLNEFAAILSKPDQHDKTVQDEAKHGMTTLLSFFAQITQSKCIHDSSQSSPLTVRGFDKPDFFWPGQFLVELRNSVIQSVAKLWKADEITKIGVSNVKLVIEILENVLKADGEDRAAKRSDNLYHQRPLSAVQDSRSQATAAVSEVTTDSDLADEGMFRCNDNERNAEEYIHLRQTHNAPRFPVPDGRNRTLPTSAASADYPQAQLPTTHSQMQSSSAGTHSDSDSDDSMSEDLNTGSLGTVPADIALSDFADADILQSSVAPTNTETDKRRPFVTVDDLNSRREKVRANLIDRCLEVLSEESQVTFYLKDLIFAAVPRPETNDSRADWGNTLVSSLLSLQAEESSEATGQKIAAYAHLVALILQDHEFFRSTLDELKDNFDAFISWIRVAPDQKAEQTPWVGQVLLIVEKVLAEDESPAKITWNEPPADNPLKAMPEPEVPELIVSEDSRRALLDAVLDILPKIGKNSMLAISVCRTLVMLTRRRALAQVVCDKRNLSRLFLMIRQLDKPVSSAVQSSFMIILRHLIEDEDSIRQTMKTEIKTTFDSHRSGSRGIDTTHYARNLHHLVLRDPQLFIQTTKEMVEIVQYNGQAQRPHQLALKKAADNQIDDGPATNQAQESKAVSDKVPAIDTTDGVVQHLLRELSNYKDVEDVAASTKSNNESASVEAAAPASEASSSTGMEESAGSAEQPNDRVFQIEENSIFIYRCFIMQCLTELLACYTHLKLEFINFSRKAENQAATPSKPRSGTINYLLHQLLPVGTLEHRDTSVHRKKVATSDWATNLLVALCSQTYEKPYYDRQISREPTLGEIDPDLAFVRRFVLEHAIRSFKEALTNNESTDMRYSRLLALADLFDRMLNVKSDRHSATHSALYIRQLHQIGHLMCEKNFIGTLTSAISELDLNFPNSKRAVKHILEPLKTLTDLAVTFSQRGELSSSDPSTSADEDDIISSATSVSDPEDADDDREQTPDLFRNSTLSMYESSGMHPEDSESDADEDEDEDEEMFEGGFDEEMDYEDDNGETISDDDELEGMPEMGDIEGLPGDMEMEVEIVEDEVESEDDDDDDDDDGEDDDDEDDIDDEDTHEFYDEMDEINGDDENASLGDMPEGAWEENAAFDGELDDDGNDSPRNPIAQIAADMLDGDDHSEHGHGIDLTIDDAHGEFFDDEMGPEDDEDEGDEEDYDAEFGYEPEIEEDDDDDMGYFDFFQHPGPFGGRLHRRRGLEDIIGGAGLPRPPQPMHYHRRTYHNHPQRADDEGLNPLLQRHEHPLSDREHAGHNHLGTIAPPLRRLGFGRGPEAAMFQEFVAAVDRHGGMAQHAGGHFTIAMDGNQALGGFPMRHLSRLFDPEPGRPFRDQFALALQPPPRISSSEEAAAVEFKPAMTTIRWEEESRILFGKQGQEKAHDVISSLHSVLVPPAMEAKRLKDIETAERKAAEDRAREEEERQAAEKAEREAEERRKQEEEAARLDAELAALETETDQDAAQADAQMSGTGAEQPPAEPEAEVPRVLVTMRGQTVDITNLGIDREYLLALPEEFREEVIMSQLTEQRAAAPQTGEAPNEISEEFMAALPAEIQRELRRSEQAERRRRERAETARASAEAGNARPPQAQDMDAGDFLATLMPGLRNSILMDAHSDQDYLNSLPDEFQREVRARYGDAPRQVFQLGPDAGPRLVSINTRPGQEDVPAEKTRPRPVMQMLDKAGVATLLRLMFITLQASAKTSLRSILSDVCKNTQNRAEVISILLSILQDGTADVNAVERSFAQLSLRAKQNPGPKTPQPLKRTLTGQLIQPVTELSPLNIVQQCLSTLASLSSDNPKVQLFFLSEHETLASNKAKSGKKAKGRENSATKYPLNALLTLLDRKLITENVTIMETLATLLSRVTSPLQILLKKAKQKAADTNEESTKDNEQSASNGDDMEVTTNDQPQESNAATGSAAEEAPKPEEQKKKRSLRELEAPVVPEENIRLVVNILSARECPSKTFSDTLDIIKHMAAIPGAKEVFGKELIRQASELGGIVVNDLDELTAQINAAQSGTDLQGMALRSFSSAGAKQRNLLRILVALDHLFDPKRMADGSASTDVKLKEDILATLYESETFQTLWKNLSVCLTAIRQRGDLVNVATILLPLIESLMVVCRNSSLKDAALQASQAEVNVSTPPPEARMEGLFFTFTEDHRKILNELIRNNPKLMNGNLSVLAKNSKVLEFDNKRNYFNRKLHNRGSDVRPQHPALTLNIRREDAFMDSYKALFFKSGEEIKSGKLNIRFNGEEGIDAGGVTREWFSVMSRQMFNPNFALFNPVASDRTTFHPNPLSDINDEHLPFFKFIGRIIGKALYEGRVLDCHFSRAVYRRILGKSVSLKDMESLDLEYYKSLIWILEHDITDVTFETFSVEVDRFGVVEVVDLKPDGRNIAVTEDNKQEYVRLVVEHRLIKSVEQQLESFLKGFHDIIPAELISIFNEQELELLISGLPDIDVDDWKNNTEYHNYQPTAAQIQWFWRAVKSFDPEERAKLLQFVTGTSKVPLNGFKELEGMNGFARFNIHRDYSSKEKLPTSHTCFNQLDLPEYESYETLRQQLYTAITAGSEYFGFA